MNKEERNNGLVPPMPEAFSEAVDKAVFSAIRKENEQRQAERLEEKKQSRKQWWRRMGAAAAVGILLLATAFTIGLGLMSRENKTLENTEAPLKTEEGAALSKGMETADASEAPNETAEEGDAAVTPGPVNVGEPWDGDLYNIPLYSNPAPNAVRYDLTEGYAYADTVFDMVQEKLRWLNENDYDELWLVAVMDLSKADFENVTYHGSSYFSAAQSGWIKKQDTLFALVQYDFGEGEGPLLAEFNLDESGKPVSCDIKTLSCDPELDGRYYRKTSEYGSPAVYVLYGTGARKGQLTCGDYTIDFTSALPLEQVQEKLKNSAHKEHIREWYLYPAPTNPTLQLFNAKGEEQATQVGAAAAQTMASNADAAFRVTYNGKTEYAVGVLVQSGLDNLQKQERIRECIEQMTWAWDVDYPETFRIRATVGETHSLCIETNLPEMTVKQVYVYQSNTFETIEQWVQNPPKTAEELFALEPDLGERVVCFLVESQGQEYLIGFSLYINTPYVLRQEENVSFTPGARRYDLTGGWAHSDMLLDAVEAALQSKGVSYEELWLEAVYDFADERYEMLEKRYGKQNWIVYGLGQYCVALVQCDFSEGAGPMMVRYDYGSHSKDNPGIAGIFIPKVNPNVDSCFGVMGETDSPYAIPDRYFYAGANVRKGQVRMSRALMHFTSQLPLEQVQELVKDSPYKDAAREWYLLSTPDKGWMTLYDANGQEQEVRKGNKIFGADYEEKVQGIYHDENAL